MVLNDKYILVIKQKQSLKKNYELCFNKMISNVYSQVYQLSM